MTTQVSLTVAQTMLQQLGGQRFIRMTGARDFVSGDNTLAMRLPNARCDGKRITGVQITLDPSDTYTVDAVAVRGTNFKVVERVRDVYCDNLREVFERPTGLYTSL